MGGTLKTDCLEAAVKRATVVSDCCRAGRRAAARPFSVKNYRPGVQRERNSRVVCSCSLKRCCALSGRMRPAASAV